MNYRPRRYNALPLAIVSFALSVTAFTLSLQNTLKSEEVEPEPTPHIVAATQPTAEAVPCEPVPEPVEDAPTYTVEDIEHLALAIYQEAGGDACSDETRMMVGTVVMNRVADKYFPDSIAEVLTQRAQYGRLHWTGLVWPERASKAAEAHAVQRAYDCAARILSGERTLPEDVVYQAEFEQGSETVAYSDGMYFCKR